MRMLLVILLSLLSVSVGQNIDDIPSDELPDLESLLSNETSEQVPHLTEKETDQQNFTTPTIQDISETEKIEDSDEVIEDEGSDDTCGSPILLRNANIEGGRRTSYEIGTEITYSCEFGYSADGANHISRCVVLKEGDKPTWTDPEIMCIPRSCGDPGFALNAHRIGSRFTFPNQVSFECDDGYELKGPSIRYCQVSGKWSGSLPTCEKIFCDQPFHPENGRVLFTSLEYGSQLKYECEKGFILRNHQTRVCSENGTWTGPEPLCLDAQCDVPVAPEHGFVELLGGNPRVGSIAIYKCGNEKILVGSATSKCLEIGEWTFPTPKCVEPCIVPNLYHGKIGRYETKWKRQKVYTELHVGASLKNGEELILKCDDQYEPFGRNKREEKVICDKGEWIETPVCEPAKCRSKPPDMQNGRAATINRVHNGYVVYYCSNHFKKTKYGNVTCNFGTWRGIPPICSDTRCYVDKIQFPGIVKGRKNVYLHKEVFTFQCEKGYDVNESEKLTCNESEWQGHFPPCKAASCMTSPPSIVNGRIKSYTELHSSFVSYECDEGYFLQSSSDVQCLFGEWKGDSPLCKEARCYFQNLKQKNGMMTPIRDPVDNRETIEVKCATGYSAINIKPLCSNGQWTEYGTSPCKPNNCLVDRISNGAFTQRMARKVWKWGRVTEYYFEREKMGTTKSAGESIFVTCEPPYTFQGKNTNDVYVVCSEGRWKPTPVCLPYGTRYEDRKETSATDSLASRTVNHDRTTSTIASPNKQPSSSTSINVTDDLKSIKVATTEQKQTEECYCLYDGSDDLVAYSGKELLKPKSKVKANASVRFYCYHFGYYHFMGSKEIICRNCEPWHSSEYPSCVSPVRGDVIIEIDEIQKILPGGILTIDQGADAHFKCISNGIADYPSWISTTAPDLSITSEAGDHSDGKDIYFSILSIRNANSRHNGHYRCSVGGKRAREIQICIHTKCKKFDESEDFNIYYDNKQEVNSSVIFTCKNSGTKLDGPNLLTCLSNGEWSGHPPRCVSNGCPKLEETDTMLITYSQEDRARGSTATFHCFQPRVRKGPSFIKCLPNGEWSGDAPSCSLLSCSMDKLFEHIKENVVPHMENVTNGILPYGSELQLTCEGDLRLSEPASAKCGKNGDWEVPRVYCAPGCAPIRIPPNSNLIVDPERDFYRFGEYVSLYCNPGLVLSEEVEIIMCLRHGWSESILPTCIDSSSLTEVV